MSVGLLSLCLWFMLHTGKSLPNIWILKKNVVGKKKKVIKINLGLKTPLEENGNAASTLSPLASFHDSSHLNCWSINTRAKWGFGIWWLRNSREYHFSAVPFQSVKPWQPPWYGVVFSELDITASCWDTFPTINTDSRTEGRTAHIPHLFWHGSTSTSGCQLESEFSLFLTCVTWYLVFEAVEALCDPNWPKSTAIFTQSWQFIHEVH